MRKIAFCTTAILLTLTAPVLASHSVSGMVPPAEQAAIQQSFAFVLEGDAYQNAGNCDLAERDYQSANSLIPWNPAADRGLAEVYAAQGKTKEAIRIYQELIAPRQDRNSSCQNEMRTLMRYAILLSQNGQWSKAAQVYENALPKADFSGASQLEMHFDPQLPFPAQLQALAHIAIGLEFSGNDNKQAFVEFEKGVQFAPESPLTNYYYGYGWQHIDPSERAKFGTAQKAKAALQKAARLGTGGVKTAAEKALRSV